MKNRMALGMALLLAMPAMNAMAQDMNTNDEAGYTDDQGKQKDHDIPVEEPENDQGIVSEMLQDDPRVDKEAGEEAKRQQQAGAAAVPYNHEIVFAADRMFSFGDDTRIGFSLGYLNLIKKEWGLEVGYRGDFELTDVGNQTVTEWQNLFGIRYNLSADNTIANQMFADFALGFDFINDTGSDVHFMGEFGLGKRFDISDRVSYTPRVSIQSIGGDVGTSFRVTVLALSLFF